tara:strand:+ start:1238 stop:1933 length:696 start_codon:yes stop_codon:yes gene_type:complete
MKTNLLLPIAGNGQRFIDAGYSVPKPLIEINGKTILDRSLESVKIDNCNLIFIIREDHCKEHNLNLVLRSKYKDCKIVIIPGLTDGALSTCLLAKEHIDNDEPLIIFTPDCYFEPQIDPEKIDEELDGMVCVFESDSPAHSYVLLDKEYVSDIAEKEVISNLAIGGLYYWKKGSNFVKYGSEMIERNERVKGEFYIAPVFNKFIEKGRHVGIDRNTRHDIMGTPEDLEKLK